MGPPAPPLRSAHGGSDRPGRRIGPTGDRGGVTWRAVTRAAGPGAARAVYNTNMGGGGDDDKDKDDDNHV